VILKVSKRAEIAYSVETRLPLSLVVFGNDLNLLVSVLRDYPSAADNVQH
jgi:hypothetical protein